MILGQLPKDHPLRNRPLSEIGARCKNLHTKTWRDCREWKIGAVTYNDLGTAWTETSEFHANEQNEKAAVS